LPANIVYYLDPPFFRKADRLYTHYFQDSDHVQLRDTVLELVDPWILSYDYCSRVSDLYEDGIQAHVELLYSASQNGGSRASKEVILTNLDNLPDHTRLWKTGD
jgi:DNA adenine methylase